MPRGSCTLTRTIANGGTTSQAIDLNGYSVIGLYIPTLTNGTLKPQVSHDNSAWSDLKEKDGTTTLQIAASTGGFAVDGDFLARLMGYRYLRWVAGAAQGEERTLTYTLALS